MEDQTTTNSSPADGIRLIEFVRDQDVPCPSCRYNLRGLLSTRCPECGTELKLTVGIVNQPLGAYVALLVLSSLAAGVGVLCLFGLMAAGFPPRGDPNFQWFVCLLTTSWLGIAWVLIAIRMRKRILRWSAATQHLLWMIVAINDLLLLASILGSID